MIIKILDSVGKCFQYNLFLGRYTMQTAGFKTEYNVYTYNTQTEAGMKYAKTLLLPLAGVIMNNFLPCMFYRTNMI